jgi:hypothetical protein
VHNDGFVDLTQSTALDVREPPSTMTPFVFAFYNLLLLRRLVIKALRFALTEYSMSLMIL